MTAERRFAALEKTFGRQQADDLLGKFFQVKLKGKNLSLIENVSDQRERL
jgi:hypothetical protein